MPWVERVPERLVCPRFVAEPLQENFARLDYDAYISSPQVIEEHSQGRWPVEGYTLEQERAEVAAHFIRHTQRIDFAFILLSPDLAYSLGCCYILPLFPFLKRCGATMDAATERSTMVTFWLRQSEQSTGLAKDVVHELNMWLKSDWQFDRFCFRVNPRELNSIEALRVNGLREAFSLSTPLPYLFFGG